MKKRILICALVALNMSIFAQDVITLTWEAESGIEKNIRIRATNGEDFTIDWGDSSPVETRTGMGSATDLSISHIYSTTNTYTVTITSTTMACRFINFTCVNNQATELNVIGSTALQILNCYGNQLTSIDVSTNTALQSLWCYNNQLTSIDVSTNTALLTLSFDNNQLTSIDVSTNTALRRLECNNNQLSTLDISTNTALTFLFFNDNQLTNIDVSTNTALQSLECIRNQLTSLDLSDNTALQYLHCYNNQLSSLDVSNCTALQNLWCYNNQITNLDVSGCTTLGSLYCHSNELTSLDVSTNTALKTLYCYSNELTSLDVSTNTALQTLYCHSNELTSLDVSTNTALQELRCYQNQLSTLDVSDCTALINLSCQINVLSTLDISSCTALQYVYCYSNRLPLSELYPASTMIATQNSKQFGTQQLSPVSAYVYATVDWSPLPAQNVFNGNYTTYDVRTGTSYTGPVASPSSYTVSNGNIIFNTAGTYTVIMNNASVVCNTTPALQVVSTITVVCDPSYVPVTGISGISTCTTIGNLALNGTIAPSNATQQDIVWSVVNAGTTGATISETTLTTTAVGTATVRATISNGLWCGSDYTQDFEITVLVPVTGITSTMATCASVGNLTLSATVAPSNATNQTITWTVKSAGTTGASISGSTLTTTAAGTVTVTATITDGTCSGDYTQDFSITVLVPVTDITEISTCTSVGNLSLGSTVVPSNATNQSITWSVKNAGTTGASISGSTLTTTAAGTVTVTATITDGVCDDDYTQDFEITVLVPVTAINYTPSAATAGTAFTLGTGLTFTPTSPTNTTIVWSVKTAGTTGASISGNTLNTTATGTVTVTATITDGTCGSDYTQDFEITVNAACVPITTINYTPDIVTSGTGFTLGSGLTFTPASPSSTTIVWSVKTAGTTGASISGNTLNTTSAGTMVVTATISDGLCGSDYTQDFSITVLEPVEDCEPVTNILNLPSCTSIGNMTLIGMITPTNATNQNIIWTVTGSGASISGTNNDILTTTSTGSVIVRATISDGLCGSDYTQDFNINVLEAVTDVTYTPGVVSTGSPFTLGVGLSVTPSTITDYVVAWQVMNAGTTGAKIGGNILKATAGGTVTVRVYVMHNACGHVMFTKDISITVNDGCCN